MARLDYLMHRLSDYDCDPRCPSQFAVGYKAVLSSLTASSSLTSRRFPVWPLVRANLDEALDECIASYKGMWANKLLAGARLSEMAQRPPLACAVPQVKPSGARGDTLTADVVNSDFVETKPESMPEIDWQLLNLGRWDSNLRFAIRSLLDSTGVPLPGASPLCGALESVRELFRLMRHFRPGRTKALRGFEALKDGRTRSQGGAYCELCWRESIRSKKLREIEVQEEREVVAVLRSGSFAEDEQSARWAQAVMLKQSRYLPPAAALISKSEAAKLSLVFERFCVERIVAGNHSCRYCSIHKPGSPKYHADLRYKASFQHHLNVLMGRGGYTSEFAFNFNPPNFCEEVVRKTAYDQVHSRLHANAPPGKASMGLREKIHLMLLDGLSQFEIARRLSVSRQAISKSAKSLMTLANSHLAGRELDPNTGEAAVSEHVRREIQDALSRGLTISAIAKEVELTKGTVDGLVRLMEEDKFGV